MRPSGPVGAVVTEERAGVVGAEVVMMVPFRAAVVRQLTRAE